MAGNSATRCKTSRYTTHVMRRRYVTTDLEERTRRIFDKIHKGHVATGEGAIRIRRLLTPENMKLPANYFVDKVCGDLGCGSAASGTYNLLQMGARYVHGMDLNDSFIGSATEVLETEPDFHGRWELNKGSLEKLPYPSEYFDFVLCQGVIHHVDNDMKALEEINRTLKQGGMANIMVHGKGGLLTRFVMEILRDEYKSNKRLARFVDDELSVDVIKKELSWLRSRIDNDGTPEYKACISIVDSLEKLIDDDLILTVRDRLQAPLYKTYAFEQFEKMLKRAGFKCWYRISRKPSYKNIRKFLSPLYLEYDAPLSRLLYGDGMITLMVTK